MNRISPPRLATQSEMEAMVGKEAALAIAAWYRCDFVINGTSYHVHAASPDEAQRLATKAVMDLAKPDTSSLA